jgi:hypothetical protein
MHDCSYALLLLLATITTAGASPLTLSMLNIVNVAMCLAAWSSAASTGVLEHLVWGGSWNQGKNYMKNIRLCCVFNNFSQTLFEKHHPSCCGTKTCCALSSSTLSDLVCCCSTLSFSQSQWTASTDTVVFAVLSVLRTTKFNKCCSWGLYLLAVCYLTIDYYYCY